MLSHGTPRHPSRRPFGLMLTAWMFALAMPWLALAQAAPTEPAEVLVILASEGDGEIAPELKKVEALQKPPFSAFKSMKVLSKSVLQATVGKAVVTDLPNGRKMQVELIEQTGGRYKVRVSINKPGAKDYLPGMVVMASPGEPFFVAGQKHEGGTLIVGLTMGKKSAAN